MTVREKKIKNLFWQKYQVRPRVHDDIKTQEHNFGTMFSIIRPDGPLKAFWNTIQL